jgi:hypothetical protein
LEHTRLAPARERGCTVDLERYGCWHQASGSSASAQEIGHDMFFIENEVSQVKARKGIKRAPE